MPSIIKKMRIHDAVYWPSPTQDGLGGYIFAVPVPVRCRWDEVSERFVDAGGNEATSRAVVYSPVIVDAHATKVPVADQTPLKVGGWLMKGTLGDLDSSGDTDPQAQGEAYEVRRFDSIDKLKGDETLRIAYL